MVMFQPGQGLTLEWAKGSRHQSFAPIAAFT
jgi:hypothetical protein